MLKKPWLKVESAPGSEPVIILNSLTLPVDVPIMQLVYWLFDIPGHAIGPATYSFLFTLFRNEGLVQYQTLSVHAHTTLNGSNGEALVSWLHSNQVTAKRYANSLKSSDRSIFQALISHTIPLLVRKVREIIAVTYTLCEIYQQGKSSLCYYNLKFKALKQELYSTEERTFSSYQRFPDHFNIHNALVEAILQRHLVCRKKSAARQMPEFATVNIESFRYQDVSGPLSTVWEELETHYLIAKACSERADKDIHVTQNAQCNHTQLRSWIQGVATSKKLNPGQTIKVCSPIYSMVTDFISRQFKVSIQQKRAIEISIHSDLPMLTGTRPNYNRSESAKKKRTAKRNKRTANDAEVAEPPAKRIASPNPDQGLLNDERENTERSEQHSSVEEEEPVPVISLPPPPPILEEEDRESSLMPPPSKKQKAQSTAAAAAESSSSDVDDVYN